MSQNSQASESSSSVQSLKNKTKPQFNLLQSPIHFPGYFIDKDIEQYSQSQNHQLSSSTQKDILVMQDQIKVLPTTMDSMDEDQNYKKPSLHYTDQNIDNKKKLQQLRIQHNPKFLQKTLISPNQNSEEQLLKIEKISFIKSLIRLLLRFSEKKEMEIQCKQWKNYIQKKRLKNKRKELNFNDRLLQQILNNKNEKIGQINRKILHQALLDAQTIQETFLQNNYIKRKNVKSYLIKAKVFLQRCRIPSLCARAKI